jgi:hypothetical protein
MSKKPAATTISGSSEMSVAVSTTSPIRPRRTDPDDGTRVVTSRTAPTAASAIAASARHESWMRTIASAMDTSPAMPDTSPARTSEPARYWRVRNITARQQTAASTVPKTPRPTAKGARSTSRVPTVADTASRISWATRASAPTWRGSISSGSAVMSCRE